MADHQEASVTLPSDPASVSAARRYVARAPWRNGACRRTRTPPTPSGSSSPNSPPTPSSTPSASRPPSRWTRARPGRTAAHRRHRQPPALPQAAARRRPAGQRTRHGDHPLARPRSAAAGSGHPHPRGRQDRLDRTAVDGPPACAVTGRAARRAVRRSCGAPPTRPNGPAGSSAREGCAAAGVAAVVRSGGPPRSSGAESAGSSGRTPSGVGRHPRHHLRHHRHPEPRADQRAHQGVAGRLAHAPRASPRPGQQRRSTPRRGGWSGAMLISGCPASSASGSRAAALGRAACPGAVTSTSSSTRSGSAVTPAGSGMRHPPVRTRGSAPGPPRRAATAAIPGGRLVAP